MIFPAMGSAASSHRGTNLLCCIQSQRD